MKSTKARFVSVASAALAIGLLASAQTTTNPPPRPPSTPSTPSAPSAQRPHGTDPLAITLAEDTIQLYKDAQFKDSVVQIDGIARSNKASSAIELKAGLEDSLSSLRWNLSPGVVVIFYEDDGAKGEQLAIWGKGQIDSVAKFDFDNKASQWAWFYVGGVTSPAPHIKAGASTSPLGAEAASSSVPDNSLQLFKSKNFEANHAAISNVTSQPMGKLHTLPQDLPDSLTSLRWNLPAGTVVMFYQDANGLKQQAAIWGTGEIADIDVWDFNDKISRWAWYNVSSMTERAIPSTPSTPNDPNKPGIGGR